MKFSHQVIGTSFLAIICGCRTSNALKDKDASVKSASEINSLVAQLTQDGELSLNDAQAIFTAAGSRWDASEGQVIFKAFRNPQGYAVLPDALSWAEREALYRGLSGEEQQLLTSNKTLAGTPIPQAVLKVLTDARLAGAVAYDVSEPDPDDPKEGFWSPYPQTLPIANNMEFTYTEITPEALSKDLNAQDEEDIITGESGGVVTYKKDKCLGQRGKISAEYDESSHPNIYARGRSCQKWANNCGILMDGSLHCLPASRRISPGGPWSRLILTNPSLARGKKMLFNGHIEARNGVITSIGMSGRIAKRAARNQFPFVDPVPLLKAWGFQLDPNLVTQSEHSQTSGDFMSDQMTSTVKGK